MKLCLLNNAISTNKALCVEAVFVKFSGMDYRHTNLWLKSLLSFFGLSLRGHLQTNFGMLNDNYIKKERVQPMTELFAMVKLGIGKLK